MIPTLKELKPDILIITMTGYSTPETESKIIIIGIVYDMSKPVSTDELKMLVDHITNNLHHPAGNTSIVGES